LIILRVFVVFSPINTIIFNLESIFLKAYHKANEERKEVHQELVDTRSLLNMIKEKNEINNNKEATLIRNEKTNLTTYRVVGDIVSSNGQLQHQQQLLSSRKTPTLSQHQKDPSNIGTSTITIINHQNQSSKQSNYLPSIYASANQANGDSRLSEHGVVKKMI